MALTSLQRIRRKVGDRSVIRRETVTADGVSAHFKLGAEPVAEVPAPDVWLNDALLILDTDFTVNYEQGVITFAVEPAANDKIVFQYYAVVWTDEELQDYLDQFNGNVTIAAAHVLLAWAADVAKIAKRETLSGGGGLGAVTRDTSVASRELRNTAAALLDWEKEYGESLGTSVPADGITEIPWTESAEHDIEYQRWLREN